MKTSYKIPLKFIFDSFKGHKKLFYIFILGKIIEGCFYVVLPVLAKLEMDQLVSKNEQLFGFIELNSFNIFLVILTIIFITKFFENLLKSFIDLFQFDYIKMYDNFYSKSLYSRLKYSEPGIFLNSRNKRFINEILGESSIIGDTVRNFLGEAITNIFVLIGIITVLSLINIWIFIILIIASIITYFLEKIKEKIDTQQDFEEKYEYDEKVWITSHELGKNFNNLMSSGGFFSVLNKYNFYNEKLREKIKERQKGQLIINIFSFITENISEILVKVIVGWSIFFAGESVGTMTLVIMYVSRLESIFSLGRRLKFDINRFLDNLKKLNLFLDLTKIKQSKKYFIENFSKLEFQNVDFSYPNFVEHELKYLEIIENRIKSYSREGNYEKDQLHMIEETKKEINQKQPKVLNGVNLIFEKGKTYGLVGKNGAGKTTIISLLQNFFKTYSGDIFIDGKSIKNIKREFFEENISVINQIPYIVDGFTIRENLFLGVSKKYNDEEIYNLLDKFGLLKKVKKNRKSLDSRLGYDNDFSGGEKQLLVLIRIILQDKNILIMDEGTNQLDAENELKVMNELLKNKKDKIVIFITHRMTTIKKADKIYCLEDGKISSEGKHNELIGKQNIYNSFWEKQVGN